MVLLNGILYKQDKEYIMSYLVQTDIILDVDPTTLVGNTVVAYSTWADTSTGLRKRRNSSNTAWIVIDVLFGKPLFRAHLSADQTTTLNAYTELNIDTIEFDNYLWFNTTTHRWVPQIAGYYHFEAAIRSSTGQPIRSVASIQRNGSLTVGNILGSDTAINATTYGISVSSIASGIMYMNGSTDYVSLFGYLSGSGVVSSSSGTTWLSGNLIQAG